ncbi:MAG: hypothetical protein WC028_30830 [Candidatus Obscuribacterales bacterium]|jgi:hypothetical protein
MNKSVCDRRGRVSLNKLAGWLIYPAGDLLAQLMLGEVSVLRTLIVLLSGGLLYSFEVPAWFRQIDKLTFRQTMLTRHRWLSTFTKTIEGELKLNWIGRTIAAQLYFNPLWIARHVFFIGAATMDYSVGPIEILSSVVAAGALSFLTNLPISIAGNYTIQVHVPTRWRFFASAMMTALLTLKYAVEYRYFG